MKKTLKIAFIMIICAFGIIVVSGLLSVTMLIPTTGVIAGADIGVYTDAIATKNCTSIDWGLVYTGSSVNRIVYVKNLGTVPLQLSASTSSWTTGATKWMSFGWNREDFILEVGEIVQATFTVIASAGTTGITTFSFNIVVYASDAT